MQYFKSTKLAFLLGALFIGLPIVHSIPAQAEENIWQDEGEFADEEFDVSEVPTGEPVFTPYRVLGRGLVDRRTGEVLQMACVGAEENELSCSKLRFLWTNTDGVQTLLGPMLEVNDVDGITRKEIQQELRKHRLAAPVMPKNRIFQASQAIYLGRTTKNIYVTQGNNSLSQVTTLGVMGVTSWGVCALIFNHGVMFTGAASLVWALPFIGVPLVVDLALLPFQISKMNREFGALFGGFGKKVTLKMLQDRSVNAWQLKPRGVSHRGFKRFMTALTGAK